MYLPKWLNILIIKTYSNIYISSEPTCSCRVTCKIFIFFPPSLKSSKVSTLGTITAEVPDSNREWVHSYQHFGLVYAPASQIIQSCIQLETWNSMCSTGLHRLYYCTIFLFPLTHRADFSLCTPPLCFCIMYNDNKQSRSAYYCSKILMFMLQYNSLKESE